jgi:hypothetical protein
MLVGRYGLRRTLVAVTFLTAFFSRRKGRKRKSGEKAPQSKKGLPSSLLPGTFHATAA